MKHYAMFGILAFAVAMSLSFMPVHAYDYCANSTYQVTTSGATIDGTGHSYTRYEPCPNQCDMRTGKCKIAEGHGLTMEWYAVLFFVALGSLAYAVKGKHWLLSLFALVLFGVLAFAGFNLEIITSQGLVSYGVSSILVFLTWLFMFVSLIVLLIGVIAHLKQSAGGKHERHGRER